MTVAIAQQPPQFNAGCVPRALVAIIDQLCLATRSPGRPRLHERRSPWRPPSRNPGRPGLRKTGTL
eukprot:6994480-Lingulodinium_polyedra.AAC.1